MNLNSVASTYVVMPAKAGTQYLICKKPLDASLRRHDKNVSTCIKSVILGGMLLLSNIGIAAPKEFCQIYAQNSVKQYDMLTVDSSYECHPDKEYMPLWSPDPRDHYNWCTHKAVSLYKAASELARRERFLVDACHYDLHYAEIPDPNPYTVKKRPSKGKSWLFPLIFHKRNKGSDAAQASK